MSSAKNMNISAVKSKVFSLWPWLCSSGEILSEQECESFYSYTYSFGEDDWGDRLSESADSDESLRTVFVYKICIENGFNGQNGKPSLSSVWKNIHTLVVCPLFKKGKASKLNSSYIEYFVSQHDLNFEEVKGIWNDVYKGPEKPEYEWAFSHFYNWIQDDRKHWSTIGSTYKIPAAKSVPSIIENSSPGQLVFDEKIEDSREKKVAVPDSAKQVAKTKKSVSKHEEEVPIPYKSSEVQRGNDTNTVAAKKVAIKNKKFALMKK
jgi:hypothetical protein